MKRNKMRIKEKDRENKGDIEKKNKKLIEEEIVKERYINRDRDKKRMKEKNRKKKNIYIRQKEKERKREIIIQEIQRGRERK